MCAGSACPTCCQRLAQHGVETPEDVGRWSLASLVTEAYSPCGVELLETVCLLEPHASGKPHLNTPVRSRRLCRWPRICQRLLQHHRGLRCEHPILVGGCSVWPRSHGAQRPRELRPQLPPAAPRRQVRAARSASPAQATMHQNNGIQCRI